MSGIDYPPAPWRMHGSLGLSVFRLPDDVDERHPAGWYGVALVHYAEPSPLTYDELLLARVTRSDDGRRAVTITDIWVDSPSSQAGGRSLWAIPKELCEFERSTSSAGPRTRTRWAARTTAGPIAQASFDDISRLAPRTPSNGLVLQPGIAEHPESCEVSMRGTAKALPCRARWQFDPGGALGFLGTARQVASAWLADFRLTFE